MEVAMDSYTLSRNYFDWAFENPEKVTTGHTAIYFFAIEHCNRLGWKDKFGFPTSMAMDAVGIKKHQTYIKYFNDLVDLGFIKLVQKSLNQYSANIISLKSAYPKNGKALDKAIITHRAKQTEPTGQSTGQSKDSIDKPINQLTNKLVFEVFWDLYDKKKGDVGKLKNLWQSLSDEEKEKAIDHIPKYKIEQPDKQYRKHPETYLRNKSFNDEVIPRTNGYHKGAVNIEPTPEEAAAILKAKLAKYD